MSAGRWLLSLPLALSPLLAQQEPAKPDEPAKVTLDSPLGEPAPLPDGAPAAMAKIDRRDLRAHVFWLADDARRGRYTGSPQQLETAQYIAERLRKLGLQPLGDKRDFLQRYPLDTVTLDVAGTSIAFGQVELQTGLAVLPAGDADRVNCAGRFLYCGSGRPDEVPDNIRGRIPVVVIDKPPPPKGNPQVRDMRFIQRCANVAREFGNEGAKAGVICMLDGAGLLTNTLNYAALLPDHPRLSFQGQGMEPGGRVPVLFLADREARQLLTAMGVTFDDDGRPLRIDADVKLDGRLRIAVKHDQKGSACNVVAVLPGKDKKKEAVIVSAHMDHIGTRIDGDAFNGADDNASGTASLLEIAEAFAAGEPPARSVVFLAVSGEELGMFGSSWYTANPTWPLEHVVADVNVDMVGRAGRDGRFEALLTPSFAHAEYNSLARICAGHARSFGVELGSGDVYFHRSDQYNFAQKGIPVVFLCDGEPSQYHQVDDAPDTIDYVHMEALARLAFWTCWAAAQDKERPKKLGPQPGW